MIIYTASDGYFVAKEIKKILARDGITISYVYISTNSYNGKMLGMLKRFWRVLPLLLVRPNDLLGAITLFLFNSTIGKRRVETVLKTNGIGFDYIDDINNAAHLEEVNKRPNTNVYFVAFNQIARKRYLTNLKHNCFNAHVGYLPNYKGANSTLFAMSYGEDWVGVTLHRVAVKIDSGEIVSRRIIRVTSFSWFETMDTLFTLVGKEICRHMNSEEMIIDTAAQKTLPDSYFHVPGRDHIRQFYNNGHKFF